MAFFPAYCESCCLSFPAPGRYGTPCHCPECLGLGRMVSAQPYARDLYKDFLEVGRAVRSAKLHPDQCALLLRSIAAMDAGSGTAREDFRAIAKVIPAVGIVRCTLRSDGRAMLEMKRILVDVLRACAQRRAG
jgi:hypothetical protein